MPGNPLDNLLERLCQGDTAAAEQVFLAYEPYLRMVVRRQLPARLRAKFDSIDVVQSIWADVLEKFQQGGYRFPTANHLRAFLVKVTRNRFLDRLRHHEYVMEHEQALEAEQLQDVAPTPQPRPSEVAQAEELWQEMLARYPPAHQELLRLKREGKSLAEIAEQTGLHPSSVRRILYELARQFTERGDTGPSPR